MGQMLQSGNVWGVWARRRVVNPISQETLTTFEGPIHTKVNTRQYAKNAIRRHPDTFLPTLIDKRRPLPLLE
jgi:hypothetical protein